MLKIYIVALMLASSCELGSCTFLAALKTLLVPPNTQQSAQPALPPYPTYKAFVDPNPPKPPIRPNYVPKPFPDYKVSFASPGMGIGTNGIQLTYANNIINPSAMQYSSANINPQAMQYPSANNYINPSAMQYSSANPSAVQYPSANPSAMQFSSANPSAMQYPSANPSALQYFLANPSDMQYPSAVNPPSVQYSSGSNYQSLQYSSGLPNAPAIPDQVYYSNQPSADHSQINSQTLTSQFDIAVPAGSTIDLHLPAQFHSAGFNQDSKNIPVPDGASFGQAHVSSGIEVGLNSDSNAQTNQEAIRQLPQPLKLESSSETALKISADDEDKNALNIDIHPEELQKSISQQGTPSFSMDALTKDFRLVFVTNQNESQDSTEPQSPRSIFNANQAVENQGLSRYVNSGPSQGHKVNLGPFYTPQPPVPSDPVVKPTPPAPIPDPIPDPPKVETVPPVTEETRVVGVTEDDAPVVEPERTPLEADAALAAPERTPAVADAPLSSGGFGNFFPQGFNNLPGLLSSAMGNSRTPGSQGQGFSSPNQGFSSPNQGFAPQSQGFAPNMQDSSIGFDTPNSFRGAYYSPQQFQPYGPMYYQPGYSYGDVGSAMYVPTVMQADDYGQPEELETMTVLLDPSNEMNIASNQYGSSSGGHSYGHRPGYNPYIGSNDEGNYGNPGVSQPDNSDYRNPGVSQPDNSNYRNPGVSQSDNSDYRNTEVSQSDNSDYRNTGVSQSDNSDYRNVVVSQSDNSDYRNNGPRQPDNSDYRNNDPRQPDNSDYRNNDPRQPDNSNFGNTEVHQSDNLNYRGTGDHQPDNPNYGNTGARQPDNSKYGDTGASQPDNANFHNSYANHQNNYVPVNPTTNNEYQHRPYYNGPKNTVNSNYHPKQDDFQQPNRPVIYVDQHKSFVAANDDRQTVSTYIEDIEKIPNYYQPPVVDQLPKVYDSGASYPAIPKAGFQPQPEYHHSNAQTSDKFDNIGAQMEEFELPTVEPKFYSSTSAPLLEIIENASSEPIHSMEPNPYAPNERDQSFGYQYENEASIKNSENTDFVVRAPVYNSPDTNTDYEYKPVLLVGPFYRPTEPDKQLPINYQPAVTANVEQNVVSDKQANDFIGGRVYPADDDEEEKTPQDDDDSVDSQYHSSYIQMESASAYPVYGNAITPHTILRNDDAPSANEYKPIALIGPFGGYNNLRGKSLDSEQSELVGDYDTIQASSIAPFPKRTPVIRKKPDGGVSISRVHTQFSTSDFQEKWRNDPPYFEHTSPSEHFDQSTPYTDDKSELHPEHHHFETAEVQQNDGEYKPILMAGPFLEPPTDEDIRNDEKVEPVQEEYVPVLVAGPLANEDDAQNLVGDAISDHVANENDEEDDLLLPPNRDSDAEYKPLLLAGPFQPKGDDGSTVAEVVPTSTESPPVPPKAYDRWRTPSPRRKLTINSKRKMNEFYPTTYHPVSADGEDSLSNDVVTDIPIETALSSNVDHLSSESVYGMKIHPKLIVKTV